MFHVKQEKKMRNALGKGLDALIPGASAMAEDAPKGSTTIPVDSVRPNRLQPRKQFDDAAILELSESIKRHGLAQPIVVTRDPEGGFELVAGERRLRASKLAGLKEIPAVIRDTMTHKDRLAVALIENIQREDLNPIETAQAYRKLMADHQLSQSQLAEIVGKSRSGVANTMRLLDLASEAQDAILAGRLSEGHGRALLMVSDLLVRQQLLERALTQGLSVREIEAIARGSSEEGKKRERPAVERPPEIKELEKDLQRQLGTKVTLRCSKHGVGTMTLEFYSIEDLERLVAIMKK